MRAIVNFAFFFYWRHPASFAIRAIFYIIFYSQLVRAKNSPVSTVRLLFHGRTSPVTRQLVTGLRFIR
jgi:hypothetical protein